MATNQLKIGVKDLESTCNFIVSRLADYVSGGGNPKDGYDMYLNQLQGIYLLMIDTQGEKIVERAKELLKYEYLKFKNGSVSPTPLYAVQEVA